jgi:hypothetical protein
MTPQKQIEANRGGAATPILQQLVQPQESKAETEQLGSFLTMEKGTDAFSRHASKAGFMHGENASVPFSRDENVETLRLSPYSNVAQSD